MTADSSHRVSVKNSILSGESVDLLAVPGAAGTAVAEIAYSNFDSSKAEPETTISEGPGNKTAPPAFLDAVGGDYREAAGSPTIDSGSPDPFLGPTDYDGNPRVLGSAPDIGAFEFVPPPPKAPTTSTTPPALLGRLEALSVAPRKFRVLKADTAIASAKKAPRGATVTYRLNVSATVEFRVERKTPGRKVKGKCVRKTRANRSSKPCPLFKPVKGAFSHLGAGGENRFTFSGRIGGKALKPGAYRLLGSAGGATLNVPFRVVE